MPCLTGGESPDSPPVFSGDPGGGVNLWPLDLKIVLA